MTTGESLEKLDEIAALLARAKVASEQIWGDVEEGRFIRSDIYRGLRRVGRARMRILIVRAEDSDSKQA